ncbi:uncharacterized protein LOC117336676 [Pecten maximus]|uniref:uncharacterized protein LOC117336676 n=1 Tax=Pecten maximus TaxID=6579 RepID=UPI0014587CB1|nr:uncharacterized protein LOC117336676 [Pecten maximus]
MASVSKKRRRLYEDDQMKMAIEAVREGRMSKKSASKIFGVPRSTLLDKLSGRVPEEPVSPGTRPTLTKQEEKTLVTYIQHMADVGYPLTRKEILLEVKKVLDTDGRKTPFNNNMPGKDWFARFRLRNPELSTRTPQSLGHERALITKEMVDGWFFHLNKYLEAEVPNYKSLLNNPRRIFNADESGFPLCVKSGKVMAAKGSKHVYHVVSNSKTQITVMACFNSLGDYLPPLIVFPGQRLRNVGIADFPDAIFGQTDSGWMDSDLFVAFLEHFVKFVKEKGIEFPVILFVDGHSTHMTLTASEFCAANDVILYCLLPNATHILQACDIGLFSPMKSAWTAGVKTWQMNHIGEVLIKKDFPKIFKPVWDKLGPSKLSNPCTELASAATQPTDSDVHTRPSPTVPQSVIVAADVPTRPTVTQPVIVAADVHIRPADVPTRPTVPQSVIVTADVHTRPTVPQPVIVTDVHTRPANVPTRPTVPQPVIVTADVHTRPADVPTRPTVPQSVIVTADVHTRPADVLTRPTVPQPVIVAADVHTRPADVPTRPTVPQPVIVAADVPTRPTVPQSVIVTADVHAHSTVPVTADLNVPPPKSSTVVAEINPPSPPILVPINYSDKENVPPFSATESLVSLGGPTVSKRDPNYVSPAFKLLSVPEPKNKKKTRNVSIRTKLPKALSGKEALKMFREQQKQEAEALNVKRKEERERKRKEKEEEQEKNKQERENKKKQKIKKNNPHKKMIDSESDDSFEDQSDDDSTDDAACANCGTSESEGPSNPWVGCDLCSRWFHLNCTNDKELMSLRKAKISKYTFACNFCTLTNSPSK